MSLHEFLVKLAGEWLLLLLGVRPWEPVLIGLTLILICSMILRRPQFVPIPFAMPSGLGMIILVVLVSLGGIVAFALMRSVP